MRDLPATFLPGLAFAALAAWSWIADRRRMRRRNLDDVGIMPWTGLFVWSLLPACVLLGLALREWAAG